MELNRIEKEKSKMIAAEKTALCSIYNVTLRKRAKLEAQVSKGEEESIENAIESEKEDPNGEEECDYSVGKRSQGHFD